MAYSSGAPYLEDIGVDDIRDTECGRCGVQRLVEGTHYRDSETFTWECSKCGHYNTAEAPLTEIDPR